MNETSLLRAQFESFGSLTAMINTPTPCFVTKGCDDIRMLPYKEPKKWTHNREVAPVSVFHLRSCLTGLFLSVLCRCLARCCGLLNISFGVWYDVTSWLCYPVNIWGCRLCSIRGSNPGGGEILHTHLGRPWDPPSLLQNWCRDCVLGGKAARGWR
jgi:hypothetical protein